MDNTVIEIVTFKLNANVKPEALEQSHDKMNTFLHAQTGFLYRSLSQDDEGLCFDIIYWKDMEAAMQAEVNFKASDVCQTIMPLIQEDSVQIRRMPALAQAMTDCAEAA